MCSRAVSMHMFCPTWSIVPPCGCHLQSLILSLLHSVVRSAERLCEGELSYWGHKRKAGSIKFIT